MSQRQSECDPQQVGLFLSQQLDPSEQTAFERHLETCVDCRRSLEAEVARDDAWAEAREFLTPDAGDPGTLDDGPGTGDFIENDISSVLGLLAPTDDPAMLGRLAGYEIVGVIGRGGMGVVLKGFDARLNRFVAIKSLAPHLAASGSARRRFAREARAAAAVVHENVIAIHGVAEWQGLPYLVMPYVKGESLQKRVDRAGPLGVQEVLRIGRQMAAGLAAAHAQGLVHRDIKPANILLEEGIERLQITDFGLARTVDDASETRTGIIAGTPQYMSPEQARGDAVDARSDLFSLGSVMYQTCTGRPPFRAETPYGILRRITDTEPRAIEEINPDIPAWLAALVGGLHAKEPADRPAAAELAVWLEGCLAHVQRPAAVPLPEPVKAFLNRSRQARPSLRSSLHRWWNPRVAIAATVLLAVGAMAVTGVLLGRRGANQTSTTQPETAEPSPVEWDAGAKQLETLKTDLNELADRSSRLWDAP